ncbi:MAG: hypothetical protein L3K26_17620, partial [Candidatus Hydrogenedentes bacterium]|nr:hypothetical protein [Candidatus Hydrogenedentota bacterium]
MAIPEPSQIPQNVFASLSFVERLGWWCAPSCFLLAGLFYRLGLGQLASYFYLCVLLSTWFVLVGILCGIVAASLRAQRAGRKTRLRWGIGPLVFIALFRGLYG